MEQMYKKEYATTMGQFDESKREFEKRVNEYSVALENAMSGLNSLRAKLKSLPLDNERYQL